MPRKWPIQAGGAAGPAVALSPDMRCIASFTLLTAAATLTACTDPSPYMAISDAPGAIDESRETGEWNINLGSSGYYPAGTLTLPALVTLRVEGRKVEGEHDVNDPLAEVTLAVVDGSACRLTAPLACSGGICFAEVELTQQGLCLVRASGATADGARVDTCWFRGTWEQDAADPGFMARMDAMTEDAVDACLDR